MMLYLMMAAFWNLMLCVVKHLLAMFLRRYHPSVCQGTHTHWHGVISQKTWIFNTTTSCKVTFVSADQRDVKQASGHPGVAAPQCRATDGRAGAQPGQADQRFRGESQVQPLVTEWEHQADPVGGGCSSGLPQRDSLQRNKKGVWPLAVSNAYKSIWAPLLGNLEWCSFSRAFERGDTFLYLEEFYKELEKYVNKAL